MIRGPHGGGSVSCQRVVLQGCVRVGLAGDGRGHYHGCVHVSRGPFQVSGKPEADVDIEDLDGEISSGSSPRGVELRAKGGCDPTICSYAVRSDWCSRRSQAAEKNE